MSDLDQEAINNTQTLLDAVQRVIGSDSGRVPLSAILIYKMFDTDGNVLTDYVATHDLDMLNVIGLGTVVVDDAREWFRRQFENDD